MGGVGRPVRRADQHRGPRHRTLRRLGGRLRRGDGAGRRCHRASDRDHRSMYEGTWYASGGGGIAARFIADAGGDYVYADDTSTGSITLDIEQVLVDGADAQVWVNPTAGFTDEASAVGMDSRYGEFGAWAEGGVWSNATPPDPSISFIEQGPVSHRRLPARLHPDLPPGARARPRPRVLHPAPGELTHCGGRRLTQRLGDSGREIKRPARFSLVEIHIPGGVRRHGVGGESAGGRGDRGARGRLGDRRIGALFLGSVSLSPAAVWQALVDPDHAERGALAVVRRRACPGRSPPCSPAARSASAACTCRRCSATRWPTRSCSAPPAAPRSAWPSSCSSPAAARRAGSAGSARSASSGSPGPRSSGRWR